MLPAIAPTMDAGLKDKVVVLTGASGGIGGVCARAFADEGARLADPPALEQASTFVTTLQPPGVQHAPAARTDVGWIRTAATTRPTAL